MSCVGGFINHLCLTPNQDKSETSLQIPYSKLHFRRTDRFTDPRGGWGLHL